MLAWTLEKNGYFTLQGDYQRNITDSAFVSTRVTRNGKKYEVVVYAGGGPLELWMIHRRRFFGDGMEQDRNSARVPSLG